MPETKNQFKESFCSSPGSNNEFYVKTKATLSTFTLCLLSRGSSLFG